MPTQTRQIRSNIQELKNAYQTTVNKIVIMGIHRNLPKHGRQNLDYIVAGK